MWRYLMETGAIVLHGPPQKSDRTKTEANQMNTRTEYLNQFYANCMYT